MKIFNSGDTLDNIELQTVQILSKDTSVRHRDFQGIIILQPGIYKIQVRPDIKKGGEVYSSLTIWKET